MKYTVISIITSISILFYSHTSISSNNGIDLNEIRQSYIKIADRSSQVYFYINKYCEIYHIPKKYAFNVAGLETGYKGPKNKKYNPHQVSYAGALGPMQVMLETCRDIWKNDTYIQSLTDEQLSDKLLHDIEFNVHSSIKYLRMLYDKKETRKDWRLILGFYNTGKVKINDYALEGIK